jgi:hypothetical protein
MGGTFSSWARTGAAAEAPQAAPGGGGGEKEFSDELADSYVLVDGVKTSWPELMGHKDLDAAEAIVEDRNDVRVYFYDNCKYAPPTDFNPKRVALFCNSGLVVAVPKVG